MEEKQSKHPFPGTWQWWASYDGGENMTVGPAADREEIIQMVLDDGIGEHQREDGAWRIQAEISECLEGNVDLAEWFDVSRFLEDAAECMDDNDCGANEDGDHPLDDVTPEQQADLQSCVEAVMRDWQKRHGLKLRSYYFAEVRKTEKIDLPHPLGEFEAAQQKSEAGL
jgi:hypothetical protein